MAFVNYNLACPSCQSSDAFAIDDSGWGTCFSCSTRIPPDSPNRETWETVKQADLKPMNASEALFTADLADRKLTKDTCTRYGVGWNDGDLYFPIGSAAKIRINGEKQFKIIGDFQADKRLFGQERFPAGQKYLIVTEGEFDAMAAYQMMQGKTPCVSVRNGAQSAVKDCKENYDYLDSFESIVFAFDGDAAGLEAQAKCCELFSHKAKYMIHPEGIKDPNDYLLKNKTADFVQGFWRAEKWTPDGIVCGSALYDEVMKPLEKADCFYPFDGLNDLTYGIRKHELVTVTAGSGLGKSQFLREVIWSILQSTDSNVGCMFLEESIRKTGLSLMSLAANKPLHLPDAVVTQKEKDDAFAQTLGTDRLYFLNHFGSGDVDSIVNHVRYLAKAMGCEYVFLDHISIVVSAQNNGDERKAIDEIMTKLRMLVQETGISLICVSHLKRPETKGHEEGAATSLAQLRGSGSIAQLSDMVIGLERNGQADDVRERNTTYVRVLKNRFAGITGKACALLYSLHTGRMTEVEEEDDL